MSTYGRYQALRDRLAAAQRVRLAEQIQGEIAWLRSCPAAKDIDPAWLNRRLALTAALLERAAHITTAKETPT